MDSGLPGIQPEHFELLRQAGIRRFEQLRSADPHSLWQKITQANTRLNLLPTMPSQTEVVVWINTAQRLTGELPGVEAEPGAQAAEQDPVADDLAGRADDDLDEVRQSGEHVHEERRRGAYGAELPGEEELTGRELERDRLGGQERYVGEIPGEDHKPDW